MGRRNVKSGGRWKVGKGAGELHGKVGNFGKVEANEVRCEWVCWRRETCWQSNFLEKNPAKPVYEGMIEIHSRGGVGSRGKEMMGKAGVNLGR